jgi:deoxyribose-phosphate aldolase
VSVSVGYPLGTHTASAKGLEARLALEEGATEVTLVPNLAAFKSGRREVFRQDVAYVAKHCRQVNPDALLKVLLYADLLTLEELREAVRIIRDSRGQLILFGTYASQLPSPTLVRQWVTSAAMGAPVGVMAEVRSWEEARPLLDTGLNRLATPWGIEVVQEALEG